MQMKFKIVLNVEAQFHISIWGKYGLVQMRVMFHASVTGCYAHTVIFIMDAVPLHVCVRYFLDCYH